MQYPVLAIHPKGFVQKDFSRGPGKDKKKPERTTPSDGGPAATPGNSRATEGPPSVS
jgi:hypothetical protein